MNHQANIKTVLATIIAVTFALLGIVGCKKDALPNIKSNSTVFVSERSALTPTVINGMLYFESFADLQAFIKSLEDKETDTLQVRSAYEALGVDVNAETLPNITDHPICLLAEQNLDGYISARKAEETVINAALDAGDGSIVSIVSDPYWKTILNVDRSIKIGNRIYRFFEHGGIAIVLNNDWPTYNAIKPLAWENLGKHYNLVVTHRSGSDFEEYFNLNERGEIVSEHSVFKPRFNVQTAPDGTRIISNVSLIASVNAPPSFTWTHADNTTYIGKDPNRSIYPGEAITVTINDGAGRSEVLNADAMFICDVTNFTITPLGNNLFRFGPAFDPTSSPYYTKWVFSDGTTLTGSTVTKTFISNGWARCEVYWKNSNALACQATKTVVVKCGEQKAHGESFEFEQSNQRWKLDGSIWVRAGQVGCTVKYLRWRGAILGWQAAFNERACAELSGTYIREVSNPTKTCLDITASGGRCLGEGTFPTSVSHTIAEVATVFGKPGQLSASLGIRVNGTFRGWGFAGKPRLVLP